MKTPSNCFPVHARRVLAAYSKRHGFAPDSLYSTSGYQAAHGCLVTSHLLRSQQLRQRPSVRVAIKQDIFTSICCSSYCLLSNPERDTLHVRRFTGCAIQVVLSRTVMSSGGQAVVRSDNRTIQIHRKSKRNQKLHRQKSENQGKLSTKSVSTTTRGCV